MAAAVFPALRPTPPASKLPALLPTPPRSQMLPLLPTPCLVILPASFFRAPTPPPSDPKPGRADSVERWDARKKASCSSASSSSSSSSSGLPCRADSCERWDAHKNKKAGGSAASSSSRASSGSPGRADSCERWDAHKTPGSSASSTGSNGIPGRSDSVERWDSSKRPLSRASSAERWDINKKPRPEEDYALCSGKSNSTSRTMNATTSAQMISKPQTEPMVKPPPALLPFAGPAAYFSAPDPSMLPMPTFLLARCR
ncbi:hypothetical protein OsI_29404 [Oryza sativa Indica Group]|uniref:Uncharacterized protein n=1 Tax=Oryza sativa subsp. indica TaxID=39946 RepID=A2YVP3_ORYSI|nr:hypothetical protein OsI_29404 [Oryza sativa Indica Group]